MDVRKTNGSYEEFDNEKLKKGIREAYRATGQKAPEEVVVSITDNLYIYDKMSSQEIRRQVVDSLMSINKKVAREYIEKFDSGMDLRKKRDFIHDYIKASNAATGSKFDANANVTRKNIVTLGQELYKENNIKQNRFIMKDKIKALYDRELATQYLKDIEEHTLYKHDESGTPGYPYCVAITMYPFLVTGLRELGGDYEDEYQCAVFGNLAQCKFTPGKTVAASLRFSTHESGGAWYQDIVANDMVKLNR